MVRTLDLEDFIKKKNYKIYKIKIKTRSFYWGQNFRFLITIWCINIKLLVRWSTTRVYIIFVYVLISNIYVFYTKLY